MGSHSVYWSIPDCQYIPSGFPPFIEKLYFANGKDYKYILFNTLSHHTLQEDPMEITEVRITLRNEEKLKAFASITFDNCFVVRGLKVINGSQGYFVSMPSRRRHDGTFQDLAHPINNDMRKKIEDSVLDAFETELNNTGSGKKPQSSDNDSGDSGVFDEVADTSAEPVKYDEREVTT
jgi:stage V sporulation protein G